MELGQRALDGRQRSQAIKCLDQAGHLADGLDEVSRSIDGLGRHEKTEIQKLLGRVRALLASNKRGASSTRLPDPAIAQVRAVEQTLKSLLEGLLRAETRARRPWSPLIRRQELGACWTAEGNLARQTTPQQQGEAMLMEAREPLAKLRSC